jgi:DNA-binding transcriptional MerR regulator
MAPQLMPTVGVISRDLHVPVHRIEYVIRSRGIQPLARAGNARVFSESDVKMIAEELQRIAQRGCQTDD